MSPEPHTDRARIYVSFADEDRARAMEIVRWLNDSGWRVVADDRHVVEVGDDWSPPDRLDACDIMLCVITPGWLVSRFCHHEFAYCARRGKFVLPLICELSDVRLLPPPVRALPRVDLTREGLADYLTLRDVLTQTGSRIGKVAEAESDSRRTRLFRRALRDRRLLWAALAAAMLVSIAAIWLWARH
jgi:hypothetical protein